LASGVHGGSCRSDSDSDSDSNNLLHRLHDDKLKGILRRSTRRRSILLPLSEIANLRSLWKMLLLVSIACTGYALCRVYPSFVLFNFGLLCFLYGLIDQWEQDPTIASSSNERIRRVTFQTGTKFHRSPRPMTLREKHDFVQRRFQYPPQQRQQQSRRRNGRPSRTDDSSTSTTTTIDWETTNRLLKSVVVGETCLTSDDSNEQLSQPKPDETDNLGPQSHADICSPSKQIGGG